MPPGDPDDDDDHTGQANTSKQSRHCAGRPGSPSAQGKVESDEDYHRDSTTLADPGDQSKKDTQGGDIEG